MMRKINAVKIPAADIPPLSPGEHAESVQSIQAFGCKITFWWPVRKCKPFRSFLTHPIDSPPPSTLPPFYSVIHWKSSFWAAHVELRSNGSCSCECRLWIRPRPLCRVAFKGSFGQSVSPLRWGTICPAVLTQLSSQCNTRFFSHCTFQKWRFIYGGPVEDLQLQLICFLQRT